MKAILYKLEKSAMQSGTAKSGTWVVRPIAQEKIYFQYQPTRWPGTNSTIKQQVLTFYTKQSAVEYCKNHNILYTEISNHSKTITPKSYTETITQ
jgi:hypothetical protein